MLTVLTAGTSTGISTLELSLNTVQNMSDTFFIFTTNAYHCSLNKKRVFFSNVKVQH